MKYTFDLLAKLSTLRIWVILVAASILLTMPIVAAMSNLLKKRVDPDFLLTGMVASFAVASVILAVVLHFLRGQRQIEASLRASEEKLRTMFEMSPLGMARNSMDGRYIEVNKAMLDMVGYSLEELNSLSYWDLTPLAYGPQEEEQLKSLSESGRYGPYEKEYLQRNGHRIPVRLNGVLVTGSDGAKYIWSTVEDISERMKQLDALKKHHEEIERIAYYDILTDLPNRLLLSDRMKQALAQSERSEKLLAICYLDLDGFKPVNDRFGHDAGDRLLKEVARRMQASVRGHDTVARLGGDEFVLLLSNLDNVVEYQEVLQRVIAEINQPIVLGENCEAQVTASIGVTLFPFDSDDLDVLLRHADQAMYQAKNLGRNRVCLYT